jgi:hypothetical protein
MAEQGLYELPVDLAYESSTFYVAHSGGKGDGLAYWDGLDFGPNLSYAEEYELQGDPGEYMNAAEAAKLAFEGARLNGYIPGYSDAMEYMMTLVDLTDIDGEECYVYRCDGGSFAAGFAYAYQIGDVYMQSQSGQWVRLDIGDGDYGDAAGSDPAEVNWWGKYNSIDYALGISNYDGDSFAFTIDDGVGGGESGVAATAPDDPYTAEYGEMVFTFDGIDTIYITGDEYEQTYYRSQN